MIPFGRRSLSCLWLSVNFSLGSCFLLHEDDISPICPRSLMIPCPPWQEKTEWVEYIYPWKISLTAAVPPAQQTGEEEKPGGKPRGEISRGWPGRSKTQNDYGAVIVASSRNIVTDQPAIARGMWSRGFSTRLQQPAREGENLRMTSSIFTVGSTMVL